MVKIAINGFGRIGMSVAKSILDKYPKLEIVAVNDLRSKTRLNRVFANDFIYGKYNKKIKARFFAEKNPEKLPWKDLEIDIVLECSGFFRDKKGASKHLKAGAKKVIISAPSKDASVPTYLLGVNARDYNSQKDNIISMGSCTTNALAPVAKILDENFGIKNGFLTTVHSYTASQDKMYPNWRNSKTTDLSIIPATTGATKTVEKCLPKLKGKLDGLSLRVPTATVSIVSFICLLKKKTNVKQVNSVLIKASKTKELKGIFKVETKEKISKDYKSSSYSSVVDANLTQAFGNFVKVLVWYDNEYGYALRLADFTNLIASEL